MKFQIFSRFSRRQLFLYGLSAVCLIIFLFPFQWEIPLPGEIRYEREDRLIARENGYILRSPGESIRLFQRGESIFILDDPALRFARERVAYMLHFDRLLFEQQRTSRETLGDSLLTDRKIKSDLHAVAELQRKIDSGRKTADRDVLFIPTLGMVSPGYYIRSGMFLGKLCSGKKIVRAYADDRQIKALKTGQKVYLMVRDQVAGISGRISRVYQIPAHLPDSLVLQCYGGEIPADSVPGEEGRFRSLHALYAVDIVPDREIIYQSGRFVRAEVMQRRVLLVEVLSFVVSALRREFF